MTKAKRSMLCMLNATAIVLYLCFGTVSARAQSTVTITEWAVPAPTNCSFGLAGASSNVIYFTDAPCGSAANIGMLNTTTNTVTEWTGTALNSPQGVVGLGGLVVFADQNAGTLNMLNIFTNQLTTWTLPTPGSGPLRITAVGVEVFFTEQAGRIGKLNLLDNKIMEWTVPGGPNQPLSIAATADPIWTNWQPGNCARIWFSQSLGAQLGALDLTHNTFEQWTIPSAILPAPFIQGIAVTGRDHLFFGTTGVVGELEPNANVLTLWTTPYAGSAPTQLVVRESGENGSEAEQAFKVDFSDPPGNDIGRLLTALQAGTSSTLSVTTTAVAPTVTLVTPTTSTLGRTSTVVTPTITTVGGIVTGGFEEWVVPTSNSNNYALTKLPGRGLAFTEANGNKIGTLR